MARLFGFEYILAAKVPASPSRACYDNATEEQSREVMY
jgi:hypothetical protein